jgi:hypothetical protein
MVTACAGRAPAPVQTVQTVQLKDQTMDCTAINAEIAGDTAKIKELGVEKGGKIAQNAIFGALGVFVPILWVGLDFQNAQDTERHALESRDQYLSTLALQRCQQQATGWTGAQQSRRFTRKRPLAPMCHRGMLRAPRFARDRSKCPDRHDARTHQG